jgi:dihydroxyacetone kinase-like protein
VAGEQGAAAQADDGLPAAPPTGRGKYRRTVAYVREEFDPVETIGYDEVAGMVRSAVAKIRDRHEELSRLDSAIGDGDHGSAMLRAMEAAEKALDESAGGDIPAAMNAIGWEMMSVAGGSTGPLLGSFFMGLGEGAGAAERLDCAGVAGMFESALESMQKNTPAKVGDKTMMDALVPAVAALRQGADAGESIPAALKRAAEAAAEGVESTRQLRAKFGKARNLGERTIGHADPGATSMAYLFEAFAEGAGG